MAVNPSRPAPSGHARVLREASERYRVGDYERAAQLCREVLRKAESDAGALRLLALALIGNGQVGAGREAILRALKAAPANPDLLQVLATTFTRQGRYVEAAETLDRALSVRPDDPTLRATLADVHFRAGEFDRGAAVLDPVIGAAGPHLGVALSFAQICPRLGREREGIALLQAALAGPDKTLAQVVAAHFSIGDLFDGLREYDRAFAAYEQANRIKGGRPDTDEYFESMERMIRAWTPERVRTLPRAAGRDSAPVFIVGMPRSGTSLTEQILASHPAVFGAGEREVFNRLVGELQRAHPGAGFHLTHPASLSARGVERMSRAALRELKALAPDASRIVDKNPVNYLHLGLIWSVFPGAKVLHCVRDPLDTCLSGFFHNLAGAHVMAGDLGLMGRWYGAYRRVMGHWRGVLDLAVMDVVYEELVADQETVTRRMIEFVGLEWTDEVLRFHQTRRPTLTPSVDQVRRPMYRTSVGRWRNYEKHIGPLRGALGPADAASH
jgi:tetratricopeptide (TPR) repeat protein